MSKKVYWDELSPAQMEEFGYTYHACKYCSHEPLIFNTLIGDAICEGCGKWQDEEETLATHNETANLA